MGRYLVGKASAGFDMWAGLLAELHEVEDSWSSRGE